MNSVLHVLRTSKSVAAVVFWVDTILCKGRPVHGLDVFLDKGWGEAVVDLHDGAEQLARGVFQVNSFNGWGCC